MQVKVSSPQEVFDRAQLTPDTHPAIFCGLSMDWVPDGWEMRKKHTTMWRWHVMAWESPQDAVNGIPPKLLDPISAPVISPPSQFQESKAYKYLKGLLGRELMQGEDIDITQLVGLPVRIMTSTKARTLRAPLQPGEAPPMNTVLEHFIVADDWQRQISMPQAVVDEIARVKQINADFAAAQAAGQTQAAPQQYATGVPPTQPPPVPTVPPGMTPPPPATPAGSTQSPPMTPQAAAYQAPPNTLPGSSGAPNDDIPF